MAKKAQIAANSPPSKEASLIFFGSREHLERGISIPRAFGHAILEVSRGRKSFRFGDGVKLACDPATHPDAESVHHWLERKQKPLDEFEVVVWLMVCVRHEWMHLPHRTRTQHRELFQRIARLCRELDAAMEETGDLYFRGGGYGLMDAGVRQLMTDSEIVEFDSACNQGSEPHNGGEDKPELPRVQELLERIASAAERLERQGPIHAQPNKRGAERGYFVRRMGELFQQRYGEQPHEVIAALTTIALGEATDRELVAKLLA